MAVVSLPRAFVFRIAPDDPHPFPWMRVKLSCALGGALFPDPQWQRLSGMWDSFYPTDWLREPRLSLLSALQETMPEMIHRLIHHRPAALRGLTVPQALAVPNRMPGRLRALWSEWCAQPAQMRAAKPSLAFAVIGQARADETISARKESHCLGHLLTLWALRDAMGRARPQATFLPQARNNI
jgi:hypothetical protein